jgi:GntR family transcriptional regulator, transcriptional repressor for pyruvate dehydrogenase complex
MDSSHIPTSSKPRSLAHGVVSYVAELIRDSRIAPGEKVPSEAEIIRALGVSRSVVREAMSHMQAAGMVETRQGKGTYVLDRAPQTMGLAVKQSMSKEDVLSLLELRIMLETEAAGLAATRRSDAQLQRIRASLEDFLARCGKPGDMATDDTRLHLAIAQAANNPYLLDVLTHIHKEQLPRARQASAHIPRDAPEVYVARVRLEHEDIVSTIARQDPESARAAMRTHLSNSRERLRRAHELYETGRR